MKHITFTHIPNPSHRIASLHHSADFRTQKSSDHDSDKSGDFNLSHTPPRACVSYEVLVRGRLPKVLPPKYIIELNVTCYQCVLES